MELSNTSYTVLGMLRMGLRTGYEIKRFVDKTTRFFWAASYGQIYPELKRLEEAGLVRGQADPGSGRGRTTYELTDAGQAALHDWLATRADPVYEVRDENLLKFFFADALEPEGVRELLRAKREYHESIVEHLRSMEPHAAAGKRGRFPYLTLQFGLGFHGWIVDWCREMEDELAGAPAAPARS